MPTPRDSRPGAIAARAAAPRSVTARSVRLVAARTTVVLALLGLLVALLPLGGLPAADAATWQVVGGGPAEQGQWPSTVALVRSTELDAAAGQFCAGTAVAPDLVLTAAHCFHTTTGFPSRTAADVHVVAGSVDLSGPGGFRADATELYVHPDYRAATHHQDIALLRTSESLRAPVQRLAEPGQAPAADTVAVILGWGRTGGSPDAEDTAVLFEAHAPIRDRQTCAESFDPPPDEVVHVCAGGMGTSEEPGPDSCRGDSGGPLLLPAEGGAIQLGVTAYGPQECGVGQPGVYASVAAARDFIDAVVAGQVEPTTPAGDQATLGTAVRIAAGAPTVAIEQAVAASRAVFAEGSAAMAVITRDDTFPDALSGSALLFGRGPLLLTTPSGALAPATKEELRRAVRPGATVYLLGGTAALPASLEAEVAAEGFQPVRLAGESREATSVRVAREVVARYGRDGRPPFGTVVLATSGAWPDAVLAGQLSVWWGYPVLLTPAAVLASSVADLLGELTVERLLVIGGSQALEDEVVTEASVRAGGPQVVRLAGSDRVRTGIELARFQREELRRQGRPPPDAAVVVNVRRDDAFAHILSAAPLLGATAGVYVPVEGAAGDVLTPQVRAGFCGLGGQPLGIGGADVLDEGALDLVAVALAQSAC